MSSSSAAAAPSPRITIVGCGVTGLTTAVLLQRWGAKVTIRTKTSPRTADADALYASNKAGAHWFSFALDNEPRKKALDELSFHALLGLAVTEPDSGVSLVRGHALFERANVITESADMSSVGSAVVPAVPWFASIVPRFREWTSAQLAERAKPENGGIEYVRGFSYETVMLHAPHYIDWLLRKFLEAGGELREGEELRSLSEAWRGSAGSPPPDVVVNCAGLGCATLSDVCDTLVAPDRGQTIIVRAPGITDIWRVPGVLPTYVLPRGDGTVVLGGTHQYGDDNQQIDPAVAKAILERCARVVPLLRDPRNYQLLTHSVGLRPGRGRTSTLQRIEVDEKLSAAAAADIASAAPASASGTSTTSPLLVHSYGHGGDGFQSSWGSALVVAHLIHAARPALFAHMRTQLFHMRGSQLRTGVLERAIQQEQPTRAKL